MTPQESIAPQTLANLDLANLEKRALTIVRQLAGVGLEFFQTELTIERKRDRSLVSAADRQIETKARALLALLTPQYGFLGEEFGAVHTLGSAQEPREDNASSTSGRSGYPDGFALPEDVLPFERDLNVPVASALNLNEDTYWVLDPIDGTTNFLARSPLWSTLLALVVKGEPVLGIVALPSLGEVFVASKGNGARMGHLFEETKPFIPCRVKQPLPLAQAHISCTSARALGHRGVEGWMGELVRDSYEMRTHSDAYGYTRVLNGGIDAMLDAIVAPYDVAALQVLFDETPGACFTTLHGHKGPARHRMGSAVATSHPELAAELLDHYACYVESAAESVLENTAKFEDAFVLPAARKPYDTAPCETKSWLLAIEAGCARFRRKHPGVFLEDVSLIACQSTDLGASVKNGELDAPAHSGASTGIQVRAIVAGGTGLVTSGWPVPRSRVAIVEEALSKALEQSLEQKLPPDTQILCYREHLQGHFGNDSWDVSLDPLLLRSWIDTASTQQKSEQKPGKSREIQSVETRLSLGIDKRMQIFLDGPQQSVVHVWSRYNVTATAARGEEKRRAMSRVFEGRLMPSDVFAKLHAGSLEASQKQSIELLEATFVPENIEYDFLAVDADLLGLILHEAVGHAAEGDLVQTGASGFGDGQGRMLPLEVGPSWLNIVVDGSLDNCGFSEVDCEGTLAVRKTLVRQGRLVDGIHTRQTARAAGSTPDGCARMESVFHPSLNRMTSIWVQADRVVPLPVSGTSESVAMPSPHTLAKALEGTPYLQGEKGVLFLSGWKGGTATCSNLEFRADVARVYLLRKNQVPVLMREANFTGIATACFRSAVAAVGPVLCRSIGTCGKDGQGVATSDGGPAILILENCPQVRVIGTGEATE